jgi:hypothetical protein
VSILIRMRDKFRETLMNYATSSGIDLLSKPITMKREPEGILDETFELFGEPSPLWGVMRDTGADHVPQKMEDTALFQKRGDLVIGSEEITDQDTLEELSQNLFEDRRGPGWADEVVGHLLGCEAPKPVGFPDDPPSGFVHMKEGAGFDLHGKLFVPGQKDLGQTMPGLGKATRGDREIQARIQIGDDLPERKPDVKVEVGTLNEKTDPYGAFGQGLIHRGLHGFFTPWAVEDRDDMFGDEGLDLRDVFGEALPGRNRLTQRTVALGTMGETVDLGFIDPGRCGSSDSHMALFSAWSLLSPLHRGLLVGRLHGGGDRGVLFLGHTLLEFLKPRIEFDEFGHRRLFTRAI